MDQPSQISVSSNEDETAPPLCALDRISSAFGSQQVSPKVRKENIHALFQSIASRYDLMNDLMSGGMHRLWKKHFVLQVTADVAGPIYDVAGGTGDIASLLRDHLPDRDIHILDPSSRMLDVAKARLGDQCHYLEAHAEDWPLEDYSIAGATLSFGLRNFTRPSLAFKEIGRVLKIGGRLHILEFSQPDPWLAPFYRLYARLVIPAIGALVTGNRGAYRYLVDSIATFPSVDEVSEALELSDLRVIRTEKILFGIAALHIAEKPEPR
ncbi:MAG: ubiquinone/menaquinone biosynthesis methyltransferase [Cohaesibacter sp.]|nr:ubiquinone/menaquinone biosynthesis methyltransferase [Cohaesibacter sp.]